MKTNNDKKAFGRQTDSGWGRGGGPSHVLAGGIFPPGVRRSDSRQQKVQGKLDTFQSEEEEEEERHSSCLPRGALRCVFQVWSKLRNPPCVQFFHRLCRQCAECAFRFFFSNKKKQNIAIRERLSNLALLHFLAHSLSFARKSFSPGGESEGEPQGEAFALKRMQMRCFQENGKKKGERSRSRSNIFRESVADISSFIHSFSH